MTCFCFFNCLSDFLFFSFFLLHFPPSFSVPKSNCGFRCCSFPALCLSHFFSFALFSFLPECVSTTHVLAEVCFVCRMFFFWMVALAVIPASACRDGWHCPLIFLSFHSALRRGQTNSNTALFLVVYHVFSMFAMACKGGVLFLVSILLNEQQMSLEWLVSPHRMLLCICATSVFFSSWCVSGFSFRLLFPLFFVFILSF